jgi:hypothetical protein
MATPIGRVISNAVPTNVPTRRKGQMSNAYNQLPIAKNAAAERKGTYKWKVQ